MSSQRPKVCELGVTAPANTVGVAAGELAVVRARSASIVFAGRFVEDPFGLGWVVLLWPR